MTSQPIVSVMMAAYNAETYIADSIRSILRQTLTDWELIILNDGSRDQTAAIIKGFADPRIRYFENAQNMGLSVTRNRMIGLATGRYLAVLDSDDIADSRRLELQVRYLNKHQGVGMIGAGIRLIDEDGQPNGQRYVFTDPCSRIPTILLFSNYFAHSTVLIRRDALPAVAYRTELPIAEDYDLWIRISKNWEVCNLRRILASYRIHNSNVSTADNHTRDKVERDILLMNLKEIAPALAQLRIQKELHYLFCGRLDIAGARKHFSYLRSSLITIWNNRMPNRAPKQNRDLAIILLRHYYCLLNLLQISHLAQIPQIMTMPIGDFSTKVFLFFSLLKRKFWHKVSR